MNKEIIMSSKKFGKLYPRIFSDLSFFYDFESRDPNHNGDSLPQERLDSLIQNNLLTDNYYDEFWTNGVCQRLTNRLGMNVIASSGLTPDWGAYIPLENKFDNNLNYTLYLYLSFIRGYYFVLISEFSWLKDIESSIYPINPLIISSLTISPTGVYKREFIEVMSFIEEEFDDAKFLPFIFELIKIKDFRVGYLDDNNCSVHDAFFAKYENKYHKDIVLTGDSKFGLEQFKK